jgi:hypothetical protein
MCLSHWKHGTFLVGQQLLLAMMFSKTICMCKTNLIFLYFQPSEKHQVGVTFGWVKDTKVHSFGFAAKKFTDHADYHVNTDLTGALALSHVSVSFNFACSVIKQILLVFCHKIVPH